MSYEPTNWQCGDTLESEKLNKMERGIAEVNEEYVPTEWSCGDVITAEKLNKMEQGIANASGGGGECDFSTAKVTVIGESASVGLNGYVPILGEDGVICGNALENDYSVVLYQGSCVITSVDEPAYTVSGNAVIETVTPPFPVLPTQYKTTITGDFTISSDSPK